MNLKTIGLVTLVIGFLMTLYTGFNYVKKEKIIDLGSIEISKDEDHYINWSPYVGIGLIAIGGIIFISANKKITK